MYQNISTGKPLLEGCHYFPAHARLTGEILQNKPAGLMTADTCFNKNRHKLTSRSRLSVSQLILSTYNRSAYLNDTELFIFAPPCSSIHPASANLTGIPK